MSTDEELRGILDAIVAKAAAAPEAPPSEADLARERARQVERERRRLETLERRLPEAFRWARRDAPELRARVAHATPARLVDEIGASPRVVLTGGAGTGKTSLAVAALREALAAGRRGAFVSSFELATAPARAELGAEPAAVRRALRAEILVLDELGTEPRTPSSAVPEVVYARHLAGRATWITTPFEADELARRYGDGIARRICDARIIRLGG